jgi:hypothetical protein
VIRTTTFRTMGAVLAVLVQSQGALAAPCTTPAVRSAFEVVALKSDLIVTALTCGRTDAYNADIKRFRSGIAAREDTVEGWFKRNYGASGAARWEDYVTQMANERSSSAIAMGAPFCAEHAVELNEVGRLGSEIDVEAFAAKQNMAQPINIGSCALRDGPRRRAVASAAAVIGDDVSSFHPHTMAP